MKKSTKLLLGILGSLSLVACKDGGNQIKYFSQVAYWDATGLINHYNTSTGCNVFPTYVVEGLYSYVRSTDEVFCQLAESMPVHSKESLETYKYTMGEDMYAYFNNLGYTEVNVSTCKIRSNAKWCNGDPVTNKDIWSYYYITHPTSTNYMITIELVNNDTLQFVWNPQKEPVNKVKELLLALDVSGTVHYDTFINYAENCYEETMSWKVNTNIDLWGAFNRYPMGIGDAEIQKIRDLFYAHNPTWFVSTGPFMLDKFSPTKLLLKKNPYFYAADKIEFDEIRLYSFSDTNQAYQLINNGTLDYWDGYIVPDTLEPILENNPDVINVKMYDPGTYGILYNLEKPIFQDIRVRQALQYVFDRNEIKNIANPYAKVSEFSTMGMCPTEAKMYMSSEKYDALPRYSMDWDKATDLLTQAGLSKNSSGLWTKNGSVVKFTIACPNALLTINALQAAVSQLQDFGFEVEMVVSLNYLGEAEETNSKYDMALDFNDLNMSFSYPTGSYQQFANIYARINHLPRYPKTHSEKQKLDQVMLTFPGLDGDTNRYEFADYINTFYYKEGAELTKLVDIFNTGIAKGCYGVQFFENITASTFNTSRIKGLPYEDKWSQNRNVEYVAEFGSDDFNEIAKWNLVYSKNYLWVKGKIQAK